MTAVKTKEARIRMLSWKTHSLVPPVETNSEPGKLLSVLTRMCFVLFIFGSLSCLLHCPTEPGRPLELSQCALFPLLKGHVPSHLQEASPN